MIATICSSVKRAFRIAPSESGASLSRNRWSEIQGAGQTHDIEFTASRRGATKFAVKSYVMLTPRDQTWELEPIPDDTGLSEDVVTRIAGSRLPVLFTEGEGGSLDSALYRRVYSDFTTIPVGSCDNVIHSVASFRRHGSFHRLTCAGIVDADGRELDEATRLSTMSVYVLPVAEIENILLLPAPFLALAELLHFDAGTAAAKLTELTAQVIQIARADVDRYSTAATRRSIDSAMKIVGLNSTNVTDLTNEFAAKIAPINPRVIYDKIHDDFQASINVGDYVAILTRYDNKGLLAVAARILGLKNRRQLEELIGRALQNERGAALLTALKAEFPNVT